MRRLIADDLEIYFLHCRCEGRSGNLARLGRNPVSRCPYGSSNHSQRAGLKTGRLASFPVIVNSVTVQLQFHMESHRRYKASANGVAPVKTKIRAKLYAASRAK